MRTSRGAMDSELLRLLEQVVRGDVDAVSRTLSLRPDLVVRASVEGATRADEARFFFDRAAHYLYSGDTPLHLAAAAFQARIARLLLDGGADCRARNRRGAEPLHYAADANHWAPEAQAETIACIVAAGADPAALNRDGTAALHRAVRTRSAAAVEALLRGGAPARQPNGSGATPLHLAVQDTGRGGSGSPRARKQQAEIIRLLLGAGARPTDRDRRGRDVWQVARNESLRAMLPG